MRHAVPLLALMLGACTGDRNYSLETRHAPVVADGRAIVTGCPDWSDAAIPPAAGATSRNYGCASGTNLAAMIADPADLLRGRTADAGTDGRVSVKAIRIWRDAVPTGDAALKRPVAAEAANGAAGGNR